MFRESVKNVIYGALDYDIFRFEDFEINKKYTDGITIKYNDFFYSISHTYGGFEISFSPGCVLERESEELSTSNFEADIQKSIHYWLRRIKRDMLTPVQKRYIENQLEEFHNMINEKLKDMDESLFSEDEGEKLKKRLDELKEDFIAASQENDKIKEELEQLKSEIDFLKATINNTPKKKWLRNAMSKFYVWSQRKENQQLIRSGVETIKRIAQVDLPDMK